jgi:hypothetical protein
MVASRYVPIVCRRLHQPFTLALGEVLAGAIFGVRQPTASDCSLYSGWSGYYSYNGYCKHSFNHRRHPVQQRVAALDLGELATGSNGTRRPGSTSSKRCKQRHPLTLHQPLTMQRVRLGRCIDVATRGRSAHPSLLRMRVGAARSSGIQYADRILKSERLVAGFAERWRQK